MTSGHAFWAPGGARTYYHARPFIFGKSQKRSAERARAATPARMRVTGGRFLDFARVCGRTRTPFLVYGKVNQLLDRDAWKHKAHIAHSQHNKTRNNHFKIAKNEEHERENGARESRASGSARAPSPSLWLHMAHASRRGKTKRRPVTRPIEAHILHMMTGS